MISEVISPISLGIEPVRALPSNAFGDKMEEVSKWHYEKRENNRYNSKWKQQSTQSNYLHKSRDVREVISPISLGMVPVRELAASAFGDEM